jgi:hypothetical protein
MFAPDTTVARGDTSMVGKGLMAFGEGVANLGSGLGKAFAAYSDKRSESRSIYLDKEINDFDAQEEKLFEDWKKGLKPGEEEGAAERFAEERREARNVLSREKLKGLPDATRYKYDKQLHTSWEQRTEAAKKYEGEVYNFRIEGIFEDLFENQLGPKVTSLAAGPMDQVGVGLATIKGEADGMIDSLNKSELEKAELRKKKNRIIEERFISALPPEVRMQLHPAYAVELREDNIPAFLRGRGLNPTGLDRGFAGKMAEAVAFAEESSGAKWGTGSAALEFMARNEQEIGDKFGIDVVPGEGGVTFRPAAGPEAAAPAGGGGPAVPAMSSGNADLDQIREAVAHVESGGRYGILGVPVPKGKNKGHFAVGRYQVMTFNVGPWTKEILGREMSWRQFQVDPQAQDAVFNGKMAQYLRKYGNVQTAIRAWFGFGPADHTGTGGGDYVSMVMGRMGKAAPRLFGGNEQPNLIRPDEGALFAPGTFTELTFDDLADYSSKARTEMRARDRASDPDLRREAFDLFQSGELSDEWLAENREEMGETEYQKAYGWIHPKPGKQGTSNRTIVEIDDVYQTDPEKAAEMADEAFQRELIPAGEWRRYSGRDSGGSKPYKLSDDQATGRARLQDSLAAWRKANSWGSVPHDSEYVQTRKITDEYNAWAEKNPDATEDEGLAQADRLWRAEISRREALGDRGWVPLPRFAPPGVTALTLTEKHLDEAEERLDQAIDLRGIDAADIAKEETAVKAWRMILDGKPLKEKKQ